MGFRVYFLQSGDAVVRIDLRRLERGVAQQLLNLPHIGSAVHQMGGKRVPQYVGALFSLYARLRQFALNDAVDRASGDSPSLLC